MKTATPTLFFVYTIIFFSWSVFGRKFKYFSTAEDGKKNFFNIKDYVTISNDPKSNLPDRFTICSSIFIPFPMVDVTSHFMDILKQDGSNWFGLSTLRDYKTLSEGHWSMNLRIFSPWVPNMSWLPRGRPICKVNSLLYRFWRLSDHRPISI